jgi:hypothetical protein
MQLSEAQQYVANKLNISWTKIASNALFSASEITTAIDLANKRAWDYRRWPFSVDALKLTYAAPASGEYYLDYPNNFADESIYLLMVNDAEWSKRNYADYEKWFSDYPTATDKFWANLRRQWFANKNALTNGDEISLFGKLRAPTLSNSTDLLAFSPDLDNSEDSGNEAICRLALATLLGSEKKKQYAQATVEQKEAFAMLDALWAPMKERESREQSINRPFFETPDFFPRGNRGFGPTNIGNFP